MKCLPQYLPLEAETLVRRLNEQEDVIGKEWVSEHCKRCGYEHLVRRTIHRASDLPGDDVGDDDRGLGHGS